MTFNTMQSETSERVLHDPIDSLRHETSASVFGQQLVSNFRTTVFVNKTTEPDKSEHRAIRFVGDDPGHDFSFRLADRHAQKTNFGLLS